MPDWAGYVRPRLLTLGLSPVREAEIVEELSQHLDDRWRELIEAGSSPDEALRLTLADFQEGNLLAMRMAPLRQAHSPSPIIPGTPRGHLLVDFWQDVRYAVRTFRKRPAFTIAAALLLALGIGSNAAIFAIINAVLLRPLPFPKSEQLMALYTRFLPSSGYDFPFSALSGPEFIDIRSRVNAFAAVAAYDYSSRNLARDAGETERVHTMQVTPDFFDVLGVKPVRGRTFTEDEARQGEACLALVAGDASDISATAVGSQIRLDDAPCLVIGVMPESFAFRDDRVKVWTALPVETVDTSLNRESHNILAIARLHDWSTPQHADAQLQSLRAYWSEKYPDHYAKGHFAISRPLHEDILGDQREALMIFGGAVLFVLLIVCVNLAALLLSNGEARRREFAVRYALGASRRRLIQQLLVEAMLLAVTGGVLGVLFANKLLAGLLALYPQRLPVSGTITIDSTSVLYTCALVVAAGFLAGFVPALNATGMRIQETMRADSRTATSSRRAVAIRSVLVVSQLALSVILLVGALLLIRSYERLQRVDLGIKPDHVLTFSVDIPSGRQSDVAAARRTLAAIEERLAAIPGVDVAGATSDLPLASDGGQDDFMIDGQTKPGSTAWSARYAMVTPRLFRAMGIPLKYGRLISEADVAGRPLVAVINDSAARLYWPGGDPVGKRIRYYPQETSPWIQIIGVVGDVRTIGPGQPAPPAVYAPFAQAPRPPYEGRSMTFVLRAETDPAAIAASARMAVASIDSGLPLSELRTMTEIVARSTGQPRFTTLVMSSFAGIAFFLAFLGLYGTLAYGVEQRVREIGVRVALGADKRQILGMIVGNGAALVLLGAAIGIPLAAALTQFMRGTLSGVSSTDPITYVAVVAMLVVAALLASYLPARRATRVDPVVALRSE
jgi:putative ABC transport system permease protein